MMKRLLFTLALLVFASVSTADAADEKKAKSLMSFFAKNTTPESLFEKLDADKDGKLTQDELKKIGESTKKPDKFKADKVVPMILEKLDADKDGKLTAEEFKKIVDAK